MRQLALDRLSYVAPTRRREKRAVQPEVSSEVLMCFAFSLLSVGQQFGRASDSFTRAQLSPVVSVDPVERLSFELEHAVAAEP